LTLEHWQPTADYLSAALEGYRFEIIPLTFSRITEFVEMESVDFLLVNPGIYVPLEVRHGISRLATLNYRIGELSLNQFGGVIFTRHDRYDINRLDDLAGKIFLAVDETSLGGFQMTWDTLLRHGIDPYDDFAVLGFAGDHDSVVMAVLHGQADAGTVRTDILERMAATGLVDPDQFKVINPQPTETFPLAHSTDLYPEWPFSKARHTPNELAQQVAVALLNMPPEHPAALAGGYAGWTVPLDYQPVHELFRRLKLAPYDQDFTLHDVVERYWSWVVAGITLILLFASLLNRIWFLNRQLLRAKSSLEARHLLILNSVVEGIYGVDRAGNSTFVNRAMAEMTGWSAEEIVGRNQHELLHHTRADGSHFPASECPVYTSCQDGEARYIREDLFWRKDGTSFPVEYACSPLRNDDGDIVGGVVVFRDINERKQIEEASRQHQHELAHMGRLNTMGEMAAGIAHEINQPLTAIASSAQACIRLLDAGLDPQRAVRLSDALESIALQAQRGGNIIRQLRRFVKKEVPVKTAVDINELVRKVVLLIQPEAQRVRVQIHTQLEPDLPPVWVQDIQIQQVIINLATNGIDAMGDPGLPERRLTIATELSAPGQVDVVVCDTGTGIDEGMRTALFKQFVTTKSRGLGLGLSISKGIIDAHEGSITLESTGPTGTTFRFSLNAHGT
jgi:two-component system sensor histidine kinase TtrS